MNLKLKAIYYCATSAQRWGKGFSIAEAKKNAGATKKGVQFYVMAAILDDPNDSEMANLYASLSCDPIDGNPKYYDDRTEDDNAMINAKHVGWLLVEKNYVSPVTPN